VSYRARARAAGWGGGGAWAWAWECCSSSGGAGMPGLAAWVWVVCLQGAGGTHGIAYPSVWRLLCTAGRLEIKHVGSAGCETRLRPAALRCVACSCQLPTSRLSLLPAAARRRIRGLGMEVCTTLGMLSPEQAQQLREAGLTAYNHNLDTSPGRRAGPAGHTVWDMHAAAGVGAQGSLSVKSGAHTCSVAAKRQKLAAASSCWCAACSTLALGLCRNLYPNAPLTMPLPPLFPSSLFPPSPPVQSTTAR